MSQAISRYEVVGNKMRILTPYCTNVIEACRAWAGKFVNNAWEVAATRLPHVEKMIGKNQDDLVEVEVGSTEFTDDWEQIRVGWHVLAGRRSRDARVDVYAELVAGTFPSSGGSVKNPAVRPSKDARFRLWVPRDFAENRKLQIITDPRQSQEPKKSESMFRIINIDGPTLTTDKGCITISPSSYADGGVTHPVDKSTFIEMRSLFVGSAMLFEKVQEIFEFWDNETPVYPGAVQVKELREIVKSIENCDLKKLQELQE